MLARQEKERMAKLVVVVSFFYSALERRRRKEEAAGVKLALGRNYAVEGREGRKEGRRRMEEAAWGRGRKGGCFNGRSIGSLPGSKRN